MFSLFTVAIFFCRNVLPIILGLYSSNMDNVEKLLIGIA